ncbi:mycothiol transferase [Nocardioides silvaticus]|uniref:mycothiol transferase n=1 Tax=Nocardioides silvaticus TaxID=2201891 RepID=UPI001FEABB11|nr:DUF664 domain-containing protein [Nocardioides silvaticus]
MRTYRRALRASLTSVSEAEARRRLVPSKTTLLSLVKHATYVERIWFGETVTGTPRADLGLPPTVDDSFDLDPDDTIASVLARHEEAVAASESAARQLALDDELTGHPRIAAVTLRWVYLHMVRELAQHVGHAEILREQLIAQRDSGGR